MVEEIIYVCNTKMIKFNISNSVLEMYENNILVDKRLCQVDILYFNTFIKNNIIYWNNHYENKNIIDGKIEKLMIKIDGKIVNYLFKNDYPVNYINFVQEFKKMVNVL